MAELAKPTPSTVLDHEKLVKQITPLEDKALASLRTAYEALAASRVQQARFDSEAISQVSPAVKCDYDAFMKEVLSSLETLKEDINEDEKFLRDYAENSPHGKQIAKECGSKVVEEYAKRRRQELKQAYKVATRDFAVRLGRLCEVTKQAGEQLGRFYEIADREI